VNTDEGSKVGPDERLPLRWGVILAVAVGTGIGAGLLGGPLVGLGTGISIVGLLFKILGN
jgi:hypothetical protein